jgi:hypothetical protein
MSVRAFVVAEALGDVLLDHLRPPHVQGDQDALLDVLDERRRRPVAQLFLRHLGDGRPDQVGAALLDKGKVALRVLHDVGQLAHRELLHGRRLRRGAEVAQDGADLIRRPRHEVGLLAGEERRPKGLGDLGGDGLHGHHQTCPADRHTECLVAADRRFQRLELGEQRVHRVALDLGELLLRGIRRGRLLRGRLLLLVALDDQARRSAEPAGGSEQRGDRGIACRLLEPDQRRGPVPGPVASCCRSRDVAGGVTGAVPASCDDHRSSVPVRRITDRAHLPALPGIDRPQRCA